MKRPSFQFYPGDWQANSNLRRCTHAEKGAWLDVMCLMHDQPEYGQLRWPLKEVAQAIGATTATLRNLVAKGVMKGDDKDVTEAFVYVPRSGRKEGEAVTLVPLQPGPLWYSSRMVRDEYVRTVRGEGTRFGEHDGAAPKEARKASPNPPLGDGPSSSSSSSATHLFPEADASSSAAEPPPCPHQQLLDLFAELVPELPQPRRELWLGGKGAEAMRQRWKWLLTAKRGSTGQRYATTTQEGVEWFHRFFTEVAASDFLTGRNGAWTNCDLTWLMGKENFAKVVQGNYANKGAKAA